MKMIISPTEQQLENVLLHYSNMLSMNDAYEIAISQEQAIIKRILDEVNWQKLDDAEKQVKRKSMLALMDKWSYEEGAGIEISYEISVVALYDCIEEVLKNISTSSIRTFRLEGALLAEKYFINEQQEFSKMRHFDLFSWNSIIAQSEYDNLGFELAVLDRLFKQMYFKWPKRPYKDSL